MAGTTTYFYKEAQTTHITYRSGMQLIHFANQQMEKHYPDGSAAPAPRAEEMASDPAPCL